MSYSQKSQIYHVSEKVKQISSGLPWTWTPKYLRNISRQIPNHICFPTKNTNVVACMRLLLIATSMLLRAKPMPSGCMSMGRLGAKYAEVGCKVYEYFWVYVYAFWVHVYESVWCMYAVVGCKVCGCWVHA